VKACVTQQHADQLKVFRGVINDEDGVLILGSAHSFLSVNDARKRKQPEYLNQNTKHWHTRQINGSRQPQR
jgi:hypothetical protein